MNILRNVLSVVLGFVTGSIVNMAIVVLGARLVPQPAGVNAADASSLAASAAALEPKHFLFPFLAHALGALVGATVAFVVAGSHRTIFAYVIGGLFLAGGIAACFLIPAPLWFIALDLVVAYLPMAWLATRIGGKLTAGSNPSASTG